MKKTVMLLSILLICMLAGCGKKEEVPEVKESEAVKTEEMVPEETKTEMSTAAAEKKQDSSEVLKECFAVLGMTKEEAAKAFGGGTENYTENKESLLGYIYRINLNGEEAELSAMTDPENLMDNLTIILPGTDVEYYRGLIREAFGEEKEKEDTPSEAGYTHTKWEMDGKLIYLYEIEGNLTIQMMNPQ